MIRASRLVLALAIGLMFVAPLLAQQQDIKLSGSHFTLNLLGKEEGKCPGDDLKGTNRHNIMVLLTFNDKVEPNSIFGDLDVLSVDLDRRNKIFLAAGEDFQVTDGNACDGDGAAFTLPSNIASAYQIYVRELAKPGGSGELTTCAIDAETDEVVCSINSVPLSRVGKKPQWKNVTDELTTLQYYVWDGEQYVEYSVNLFEQPFEQYLWDYDNNGLRLVQLRFYPIEE